MGLTVLATSVFIIGCTSLVGRAGIGIGAVITMFIGNPLSAAATPWQFLAAPLGRHRPVPRSGCLEHADPHPELLSRSQQRAAVVDPHRLGGAWRDPHLGWSFPQPGEHARTRIRHRRTRPGSSDRITLKMPARTSRRTQSAAAGPLGVLGKARRSADATENTPLTVGISTLALVHRTYMSIEFRANS